MAFNPRARGGEPSAAPGRAAVVASAFAGGYLLHALEAVRPQRGPRRGRHSGEVKPTRPALFGVGNQRVTLDTGLGHVEIFDARRPESYRRVSKDRARRLDSVEITRSADAGTGPHPSSERIAVESRY